MEVQVLQENLHRGLRRVRKPVAAYVPLHILQDVLIETVAGRLRLRTSDLNYEVSEYIGCHVDVEGAVCVPYGTLAKIVRHLGPIAVTIANGKILTPTVSLPLPVDDVADFPRALDVATPRATVTLGGGALKAALKVLCEHMTMGSAQPVLNGVFADICTDSIGFAAADGFRIAMRSLPAAIDGESGFSVILPGDALRALIPLLSDEQVEVVIGETCVLFRTGSTEVAGYIVRGTYPDYRKLIPEGYAYSAAINAGDLRQAVKAAAVVARDGSGILRLEFGDGSVKLSAKAEGAGREPTAGISISLPAEVSGEPGRIAFNARYILAALAGATGHVTFRGNASDAQGNWERPDGFSILTMPMYVQW